MHPAMEAIRRGITRGDWAGSTGRWEGLARELEKRLRAGRLSPAEWSEVVQLYSWSRKVLLCARAQALDRLNEIHAAGAYRQTRL